MNANDFFQKKSKSTMPKEKPEKNNNTIKKVKTQFYDLLEENEDEIKEEEDIQNISFSLSNCDDMNDLLDNFSNKSDEKVELEYESTTNEEGIKLIEDYLTESTKQILNSKKGLDEDVKKMSNEFYSNLVKNINIQKYIKKNVKPHYLDKTKNTNYMTKSESINSDEQIKFKNDLIGQTMENKENFAFGKVFSLKSKNSISGGKISYQNVDEEEQDEKIIEIKKKKKGTKKEQ